jgi:hemerythrin
MRVKDNQIDGMLQPSSTDIIAWSEKYATGIELIDSQHKELVGLTNQLYHACLSGSTVANTAFKDAMSRMVEYVHFHLGAEQQLLERVNYPDYATHKKQHDDLVMNILEAAREFNEGKKFVPNQFVRSLKDWIFGHIAVYDKSYAAYIEEQKKKGLLSDQLIRG